VLSIVYAQHAIAAPGCVAAWNIYEGIADEVVSRVALAAWAETRTSLVTISPDDVCAISDVWIYSQPIK
jgi:hypothetical protein